MHSIAQPTRKSKKKETHGLQTRSRPPKTSANYGGGAAAFGSRPEKFAGPSTKMRGARKNVPFYFFFIVTEASPNEAS